MTMHERFIVHLQLCFVVSFALRVTGLEEGVIFSGKALGWTTGTLIWMPGVPGACPANVPPPLVVLEAWQGPRECGPCEGVGSKWA